MQTYSGFIAIIGRPNVGKSTLLNVLVGEKISIISRKPQTTRHRILGIHTVGNTQMLFVDTPGLHQGVSKAMNVCMNRTALSALSDVDAVIFVVEALKWKEDDEWILKQLKSLSCPIILAISKVDQVKLKASLLPFIEKISQKREFSEIVPLSAKTDLNMDRLVQSLKDLLPEGPHFYPSHQVTDRNERFLAAECIREKLFRHLGEELPYAISVELEEFKELPKLVRIGAIIWVEKQRQKAIVIGKEGALLKTIGQKSRLELEKRYGKKIYLQLWVKVKESWSSDENMLKKMGYNER